MGGGISVPNPESAADTFALTVATEEYERYRAAASGGEGEEGGDSADAGPSLDLAAESVQAGLCALYAAAAAEADTPLELCRIPAVVIHKYLHLSDDEKKEYEGHVVDAINAKEKERQKQKLAAKKETSEDYAKGFGGTEADSRNEKEAAALLRGAAETEEEAETSPFLRPPLIESTRQHLWLKSAGRWKKFSGADCIMYINVLSRDIGNRPADYEDEVEDAAPAATEEDVHPSLGLPFCTLEELPATIDRLLDNNGKTILLLDNSPDQHAASYFSYKAMMEDVSNLCIPFAKGGKKRQDVVEGCRKALVGAMKTGSTFVLYLGHATIEHADWKTKLCKKGIFPIEIFEKCGTRLKTPPFKPRYKELFHEDELEHGEAIMRDGFRTLVVSALGPAEYEAQLADAIPLGYMQPLFLMPP